MYFAIITFAAALLFLLAGAVPCAGGDSAMIFRSPVFIALLGVISMLSLSCCWKRIRQPSFLVTHVGAVVILVGALIGFIYGKTTQFNMPVMPTMLVDKIPAPGGGNWDLGFSFSVAEFQAEYYNPDYTLFIPDKTKEGGFRKSVTYSTEKVSAINLGKSVSVPTSNLKDIISGIWKEKYTLENGLVLARENAVPKNYEAKIRVVPKTSSEFTWSLKVNRPLSYGGWRIYLVSFGTERNPYVQLSAKKDIGRGTVVAGIWLLMAGVFISCFRRKERF